MLRPACFEQDNVPYICSDPASIIKSIQICCSFTQSFQMGQVCADFVSQKTGSLVSNHHWCIYRKIFHCHSVIKNSFPRCYARRKWLVWSSIFMPLKMPL